jgi:hypothetical protein
VTTAIFFHNNKNSVSQDSDPRLLKEVGDLVVDYGINANTPTGEPEPPRNLKMPMTKVTPNGGS